MFEMFEDRVDAGKKLAKLLGGFANENTIVLAIPRGGVVVGHEIAKRLKAPLNIIIVRKLGFPGEEEFGIGAISENGAIFLDKQTISEFGISDEQVKKIEEREKIELERRIKVYRIGKSFPNLKEKTVLLVDDGIATGVSARAAILAIKKEKPKKIVFATPVCSGDIVDNIKKEVDEFVCVSQQLALTSIGGYYKNFPQLTDEEVLWFLD